MQKTLAPPWTQAGDYRPDIDGLRAIAILPVVLFHLDLALFGGGFVGVDVFYVISGFLITSLIAKDAERGSFSIVSFYERRARRILPALFVVLLFCCVAAVPMFSMEDLSEFGQALVATALFFSNFYFKSALGSGGYFAQDTSLLLHTWSLSIEEQFYIFFPLSFVVLHRYARRHLIPALAVVAIVSFALSLWAVEHKPRAAFFHIAPRAWELLLGALLALRAVPVIKHRAGLEAGAAAGLGMIAWAVFAFTPETRFPGAAALLPCVGAGLLIYCGMNGTPTLAGSILKTRPLVFVGAISYSLYLWHWPIIYLGKYWLSRELNATEAVLAVILSFAAALMSYKYVERPFRGARSRVTRRQIFSLSGAGLTLFSVVGMALYLTRGLPQRFSQETQALIAANTARSKEWAFPEECSNFKRAITGIGDLATCVIGNKALPKVVFFGDSIAEQFYPLIEEMIAEDKLEGRSALMLASAGCPPTERMNKIASGYFCDAFTKYATERALEKDVETIFIAFSGRYFPKAQLCLASGEKCERRLGGEESLEIFLGDLTERIALLRSRGKRVIVSLPFPSYDRDIPKMEAHDAIFAAYGLKSTPNDLIPPSIREAVAQAVANAGAEVFDPRQALCSDTCKVEEGGVSLYRDEGHLATGGVGILKDELLKVLR